MNTILGDIPAQQLGRTLVHEHILVGSMDMRMAFGDRWYDKKKLVELAVKEIGQARDEFGITAIIDATPVDTCRDLPLIREVALKTGVHIPYCTGLYYAEAPFMYNKRPEEFAKYFIAECLEGSSCPDGTVGQTKPAFLKCATGSRGITKINRIALTTMAITQRETGLPLFCHNTHSMHTAPDQLALFREYGVDLSRVIIGHASDTTDLSYLTALLEAGCHLSFDRIGLRHDQLAAQAETIIALITSGWIDRITLSHDHSVYIDFGRNSFEKTYAAGPYNQPRDFCSIGRFFLPLLRARGITDAQIDAMMITNPARLYGGQEDTSKARSAAVRGN